MSGQRLSLKQFIHWVLLIGGRWFRLWFHRVVLPLCRFPKHQRFSFLYGRRLRSVFRRSFFWLPHLAAIALGAFTANLLMFQANIPGVGLPIVITSVLISAGNALEAVTGAYLLKKFVGERNPFYRTMDVYKFTGIALVISLISR